MFDELTEDLAKELTDYNKDTLAIRTKRDKDLADELADKNVDIAKIEKDLAEDLAKELSDYNKERFDLEKDLAYDLNKAQGDAVRQAELQYAFDEKMRKKDRDFKEKDLAMRKAAADDILKRNTDHDTRDLELRAAADDKLIKEKERYDDRIKTIQERYDDQKLTIDERYQDKLKSLQDAVDERIIALRADQTTIIRQSSVEKAAGRSTEALNNALHLVDKELAIMRALNVAVPVDADFVRAEISNLVTEAAGLVDELSAISDKYPNLQWEVQRYDDWVASQAAAAANPPPVVTKDGTASSDASPIEPFHSGGKLFSKSSEGLFIGKRGETVLTEEMVNQLTAALKSNQGGTGRPINLKIIVPPNEFKAFVRSEADDVIVLRNGQNVPGNFRMDSL